MNYDTEIKPGDSETTIHVKEHIKNVQEKLNIIINELEKRAILHDSSKLEEPEKTLWERMDREPRYKYGTPEYFDKMRRNEAVFNFHYTNEKNSHHPQHHQNGIMDMDLLDLCEFICDITSYKKKLTITEAVNIIKQQCQRFGISEDIEIILTNTLLKYFAKIYSIEDNDAFNEEWKKLLNPDVIDYEALKKFFYDDKLN